MENKQLVKKGKYKNILVIRLSAMGDVAMTVPVIQSFAQQFPDVRLTFLTDKRFAPMFQSVPGISIVHLDKKGQHKGFSGLCKLFKQLKALKFDAVADMHCVLRSYLLCALFKSLANVKIACFRKGRWHKFLLTRNGAEYYANPLMNGFFRYRIVFRRLGFCFPLEFKSIFSSPKSLSVSMQQAFGSKQRPWVGIAPFATHRGKIYPLPKMELVLQKLQEQNIEMFFFGHGKKEMEVLQNWDSKFSLSHLMPSDSTLSDELILMSHLDCMISMDSANMHLASLVATPVVSVWGATHHYAGFLGWNQSTKNVVGMDMECRPCSIYGSKPCKYGDYRCLKDIKPEFIIKKVMKVLDNKQKTIE